ncbi:unnamed protein product [Paramecium sonneborni]|uniref:Uncharacterized protein n=1 Tax=Paramecium sonneborni TaxID=65129 RepID=A0A8S1LCT8_9CILI|nr:unnamed protein product [Paramecium sonneborni]
MFVPQEYVRVTSENPPIEYLKSPQVLKPSPKTSVNLILNLQCGLMLKVLVKVALFQTRGPPKTLLPKQQLKQIVFVLIRNVSVVLKSPVPDDIVPIIAGISVSVVFEESQKAFTIYFESLLEKMIT